MVLMAQIVASEFVLDDSFGVVILLWISRVDEADQGCFEECKGACTGQD